MNNLYTLVSSIYEYDRVLKQGFHHKKIIKVYENYFDKREIKNRPIYNPVKEQYYFGKNILIIPPPFAALSAFRTKLDSMFIMNFLKDIVTIFSQLEVAKIVIRSGIDNRKINSEDYIASDVDEYELNNIKTKVDLVYRNNMNMVSIKDDLREAHLVIGTLSACMTDAALHGMDYLVYDNSIYPFPDTLNYSIFSKGSPAQIAFTKDDLTLAQLSDICELAFDFPIPIKKLNETDSVLELFHGPTLAFKDFAARFMARTMSHFLENENKEITILVATSGDTGSAVANGFFNIEGFFAIDNH